jgi:hypothetical protein
MKHIRYFLLLVTYIWLRFDPIIFVAFGKNWSPRYEFMASFFGEKNAEEFLKHRVKLVKARNSKRALTILVGDVNKQTDLFMEASPATKKGREKRLAVINELIFWALDPEINQQNIESYRTRSAITNSLLGVIFQNSLADEVDLVLVGLKKIVFSRVTYLGSKGEPSPVVHDTIISGVGRILSSHFGEIVRLREERLEELTKIKLIKEIKNDDLGTGSLAFSGVIKKNDPYRNKFPLDKKTTQILLDILKHYQFSAWPDSRKRAASLIETMERKLGFELEEDVKE